MRMMYSNIKTGTNFFTSCAQLSAYPVWFAACDVLTSKFSGLFCKFSTGVRETTLLGSGYTPTIQENFYTAIAQSMTRDISTSPTSVFRLTHTHTHLNILRACVNLNYFLTHTRGWICFSIKKKIRSLFLCPTAGIVYTL
jgi:hypothetical protein